MKFITKAKQLMVCTICTYLIQTQCLFAQDEIDTTFNNRMNYVFGVLEKNRVPNGMLQDYAMEFTNLRAFNGSSLVDSNYVDYTTMSDIYNTLISSRIHTNANGLISPAAWDSLWFTQRQNGIITLSGVFFNYARFSDDAVSSGKLTISNDRFVDRYISGVWQNPYTAENVFAIAPSTDYYEVLDQSGVIKKQYKYSAAVTSTTISISDLAAGIYLIQTFNGTAWSSQQIIKQ